MFKIKMTRCTGEVRVFEAEYKTRRAAELALGSYTRLDKMMKRENVFAYEIIETKKLGNSAK